MKTNEEWKAWGKDDPLYGVDSWAGRQRGEDNEWANDEFYELGWLYWRDFSARWNCYGYNRDYCFVGTNCVFLGGSTLPSFSILGAKSLLNKTYTQAFYLYSGVTAQPVKKLSKDLLYLSRPEGFVA